MRCVSQGSADKLYGISCGQRLLTPTSLYSRKDFLMLRVGECKSLARQNLSGRYGTVVGAQLIASVILLIVLVLMSASLGTALVFGNVFHNFTAPNTALMAIGAVCFTAFLFIYIILSVFFYYGQVRLMLNLLRGKKYGVGDIFHAFKKGSHPWRIMLIQIIKSGIVMVLGIISNGLQFTFNSGIHGGAGSSTTFLAGVATIRIVFIIISVFVAIETYLCMIAAVDMPKAGIWECFKQSARLMKRRQLKGLWLIYFSFLLWGILCCIFPIAILWVAPYMLATQIIFYMDAEETLWQLPGSKAAEKARKQRAAEAESAVKQSEEGQAPAGERGYEAKSSFEDAARQSGVEFEAECGSQKDSPAYEGKSENCPDKEAVTEDSPAYEDMTADNTGNDEEHQEEET